MICEPCRAEIRAEIQAYWEGVERRRKWYERAAREGDETAIYEYERMTVEMHTLGTVQRILKLPSAP